MRPPPHQRNRPVPARSSNSGRATGRNFRFDAIGRSAGLWALSAGVASLLLLGAVLAGRYWGSPSYSDNSAETMATTASVTPTDLVVAEELTVKVTSPPPTTSVSSEAELAQETAPVGLVEESASPVAQPFQVDRLQNKLLELINQDRSAAGLTPVVWDETAAEAGQRHAEEMAELGYLSHWNFDGYGPDYRYSQVGGLHMAQENVFSYSKHTEDGKAAPITDWEAVAVTTQASLMASEGHRNNILAPEHTHVGIGVAYQSATGEFRVAQEFVNQYIDLQPPPLRVTGGERFVVQGTLSEGVSNPVINLAYEGYPSPLSLEELDSRDTYRSPAIFLQEIPFQLNGSDLVFEMEISPGSLSGLYHLRIWVDTALAPKVQAVNFVFAVQ